MEGCLKVGVIYCLAKYPKICKYILEEPKDIKGAIDLSLNYDLENKSFKTKVSAKILLKNMVSSLKKLVMKMNIILDIISMEKIDLI